MNVNQWFSGGILLHMHPQSTIHFHGYYLIPIRVVQNKFSEVQTSCLIILPVSTFHVWELSSAVHKNSLSNTFPHLNGYLLIYGSFNVVVSNSDYIVSLLEWLANNELKINLRNWLWTSLRYYAKTVWEDQDNHEKFSQDWRMSQLRFKPSIPK